MNMIGPATPPSERTSPATSINTTASPEPNYTPTHSMSGFEGIYLAFNNGPPPAHVPASEFIPTPPICVGPRAGQPTLSSLKAARASTLSGRNSAGDSIDILNSPAAATPAPAVPKPITPPSLKNSALFERLKGSLPPPAKLTKPKPKKSPLEADFNRRRDSGTAEDTTDNDADERHVSPDTDMTDAEIESQNDSFMAGVDPADHLTRIFEANTFEKVKKFLELYPELTERLYMHTSSTTQCSAYPGIKCNTGMADPAEFRKCVSDYFGRNKAATKAIDDWIYFCRKHYQRKSYGSKWHGEKTGLIGKQLAMIRDVMISAGVQTPRFTIKLKASENSRLNQWALDCMSNGQMTYPRASRENREAPMEILHFINEYFVGPNKSYAQCWQLIFIMHLWWSNHNEDREYYEWPEKEQNRQKRNEGRPKDQHDQFKHRSTPRRMRSVDKTQQTDVWLDWTLGFIPHVEFTPELDNVPTTRENSHKAIASLAFNKAESRFTARGGISKPGSPAAKPRRSPWNWHRA